MLPGCKTPLATYEDTALTNCWTAMFSVVPIHILNIIAALLCSNHVNR